MKNLYQSTLLVRHCVLLFSVFSLLINPSFAQHQLPNLGLKVQIYNFNIAVRNRQATLSWQYYAIDSNTNFIVERSNDGQTYELLSLTPYPAMSNQVFYFRDDLSKSGLYYYRVKAYGNAGGGYYSEIKTATISDHPDENPLKITHNYNTNMESPISISLSASPTSDIKVQICDVSGRLQYSYYGKVNDMPAIGSLASGIYFINAIYGRNAYSEKFAIP